MTLLDTVEKVKAFLARREVILSLIIVALTSAVGVRAPVFVTPDSLGGVVVDSSILFMMALAQMAVIVTRCIDLSVAANLALTGMVVALVSHAAPWLPIPAVMLLAALIGLGLGLINGLLIARVGIPSIVVTLGTLAMYRGMIFVIAGGQWITSQGMSNDFLAFPKAHLLGISSLVWTAALVIAGMAIFLNHTPTGRGIYAVGGNPTAARYCGIDYKRQQIIVFALSGTIAGLCGYLWVSRYGIAYSEIAQGYELTVIAACVIGGVSIAGGIGSVTGTLLGALFLGLVVNALPVINISPFWQMAISGAVILAAVVFNARAEKPVGKLILPASRRGWRTEVPHVDAV